MGPEQLPKVLPFPCQGGTRRNSEYPELASPQSPFIQSSVCLCPWLPKTGVGHWVCGLCAGVLCVMVGSWSAMVESTSPRNMLEYWPHYLQLRKLCGFSYL